MIFHFIAAKGRKRRCLWGGQKTVFQKTENNGEKTPFGALSSGYFHFFAPYVGFPQKPLETGSFMGLRLVETGFPGVFRRQLFSFEKVRKAKLATLGRFLDRFFAPPRAREKAARENSWLRTHFPRFCGPGPENTGKT